jgi:hypothetical protein
MAATKHQITAPDLHIDLAKGTDAQVFRCVNSLPLTVRPSSTSISQVPAAGPGAVSVTVRGDCQATALGVLAPAARRHWSRPQGAAIGEAAPGRREAGRA